MKLNLENFIKNSCLNIKNLHVTSNVRSCLLVIPARFKIFDSWQNYPTITKISSLTLCSEWFCKVRNVCQSAATLILMWHFPKTYADFKVKKKNLMEIVVWVLKGDGNGDSKGKKKQIYRMINKDKGDRCKRARFKCKVRSYTTKEVESAPGNSSSFLCSLSFLSRMDRAALWRLITSQNTPRENSWLICKQPLQNDFYRNWHTLL